MSDSNERNFVPFGDWRLHIEIPEPRMFPCRLVPERATDSSGLRDLRCELRSDEPPAQPETPERPDGEWPFAANRLVTTIASDVWVYTAERIEREGWRPRYRISNDSIQEEWKFEVNTFDLEFALKIMYALSGEWDEVNE